MIAIKDAQRSGATLDQLQRVFPDDERFTSEQIRINDWDISTPVAYLVHLGDLVQAACPDLTPAMMQDVMIMFLPRRHQTLTQAEGGDRTSWFRRGSNRWTLVKTRFPGGYKGTVENMWACIKGEATLLME